MEPDIKLLSTGLIVFNNGVYDRTFLATGSSVYMNFTDEKLAKISRSACR